MSHAVIDVHFYVQLHMGVNKRLVLPWRWLHQNLAVLHPTVSAISHDYFFGVNNATTPWYQSKTYMGWLFSQLVHTPINSYINEVFHYKLWGKL